MSVNPSAKILPRPGLSHRVASALNSTVFMGLLVIIVIAAIPYGTVDPWWEALFESAVFLVAAIWMLEGLFRGTWETKKAIIFLPMILMAAYAFFQTVELPQFLIKRGLQRTLTIDRYQTHLTAVKILSLTVFGALLLLHTSSLRRLTWLIRVLIGVGLASSVFGILRQLIQSPTSETGFVLPFLFYGMGYGQFLSGNAFAYVAEISLALVLGLVLGAGVRRDRIPIYLAVAVVIWTALVLSNSRGGILAFISQSMFLLFVGLAWYSARRAGREPGRGTPIMSRALVRASVVVFISVVLIVGVFWMGGDRLAGKGESTLGSIDGTTRSEIWHSTWKLITKNPLTGVGFGAYFLAIPEYQTGSGKVRVQEAHNDYLELVANGGIVAVLLAAWFVTMVLLRALRSLKSADPYRRAACLGALAGILSVSVHSLVDFGLQLTGIAALLVGLIVVTNANVGDERPSRRFPQRAGNRTLSDSNAV